VLRGQVGEVDLAFRALEAEALAIFAVAGGPVAMRIPSWLFGA